MAWSLWSACDEAGLQMRSRVCDAQGSAPCVGNSTQRRDCNEIPGESVLKVLEGDAVVDQEQTHKPTVRVGWSCWNAER